MRKVDAQLLERVSRRLGDCIIDPAIWPEIMQEICHGVGATGAILLQSDVRTADVPVTDAVASTFARYFREGWHRNDLRADRGVPLLLSHAKVLIDQDLVTVDEMLKSPYYNEIVFGSGLKWFMAVGFRADSSLWALAIQRTAADGPFSESDKRVVETLSQRLTEVATLSTAVRRIALTAATDVLDAVNVPTIAINRLGVVLGTNAAAQGLFGDDLFIINQRLRVRDKNSALELDRLLARIAAASDLNPLACPIVLVHRGAHRRPILVRTLPVPPSAKGPFLGARALLTFTPLGEGSPPKVDVLMRIFGLTPAEGILAAAIASGASPEEVAEQLHISLATARNQLKAVFAKTSTHRQAELTALLSRLAK